MSEGGHLTVVEGQGPGHGGLVAASGHSLDPGEDDLLVVGREGRLEGALPPSGGMTPGWPQRRAASTGGTEGVHLLPKSRRRACSRPSRRRTRQPPFLRIGLEPVFLQRLPINKEPQRQVHAGDTREATAGNDLTGRRIPPPDRHSGVIVWRPRGGNEPRVRHAGAASPAAGTPTVLRVAQLFSGCLTIGAFALG